MNPKTLWDFNTWKFSVFLILGGIIGFLFFMFQIRLDEGAYYYTLSSIFQGLFAILALAGIFIVFQSRRWDEFIDKFDRDIREDINNFIQWGNERRVREKIPNEVLYLEPKEPQKILNHLDLREMEGYFEILQKIKTKIPNDLDKYYQENLAYERCYHRGFLICHYRTLRDCVLALLKRPMYHGIIVVLGSIIFLPLLNSNSPFNYKLPMEIVIGVLVIGTVIVIFEVICLIRLTLWEEPLRRNWQKADHDKPYETIKRMKSDESPGYKSWREVIEEAKGRKNEKDC